MELRAGPLPPVRFTIDERGYAACAAAEASAALVVTLKPEAPALAVRGEDHLLRAVEVSGNARLADAVMALARHLRWDYEEDLSRVAGDVAAHRIGEAWRAFAAWQLDAAQRLAGAFADYAAEEGGMLVRRAELAALATRTAALRDALERLDERMRRLG